MKSLDHFRQVWPGIWACDGLGRIKLNEDYKRTFTAYSHGQLGRVALRNAAGNPKRFRSAEAAATALVKAAGAPMRPFDPTTQVE